MAELLLARCVLQTAGKSLPREILGPYLLILQVGKLRPSDRKTLQFKSMAGANTIWIHIDISVFRSHIDMGWGGATYFIN